jgi:glyoxylase-like metal-dependent hydrolase (beta-lactamase superfamily II)
MTDAPSTLVDFVTGAPASGSLDVRWIHGAPARRRPTDPPIQVHQYDPHTVIMRQSKSVNYEAPFLFLLFGNDRALLLDTGATEDREAFPLRATVDQLIARWLAEHRPGRPSGGYELVVAHTHGHGDHVAGDAQFEGRPDTTLVPRELDAVQAYFGFTGWPQQIAAFDLGGRVLEVTGSPGHHRAAITVYDPWAGLLLTGDTVYPGRLYAFDFPQFVASLDRMVALADSRPVTHVLGCHIEMTRRPGRDYPLGAPYQPDEPPLEMTVGQLRTVRAAAQSVAGRPGEHRFDDFIIYNEPGRREQRKLAARARVRKFWPMGISASVGRS